MADLNGVSSGMSPEESTMLSVLENILSPKDAERTQAEVSPCKWQMSTTRKNS